MKPGPFSAAVAAILFFATACIPPAAGQDSQGKVAICDHHVHLLSPQLLSDWKAAGAAFSREDADYTDVERVFASQNVSSAFLVSMAHLYASPEGGILPAGDGATTTTEQQRVALENDWIARAVARVPDRAIGFFSVNPLRDYATDEMNRCRQRGLTGLKLHLPACGVDLRNASHLARLKDVFKWAADNRVPVLLHLFTAEPDGDVQAVSRLFWRELAGSCKGLDLCLAHLGSAGGFNRASQTLLDEFLLFRESGIPAGSDVHFDLSGAVLAAETDGLPATSPEMCQRLAGYIRTVGADRFFFASDYPVFSPAASAAALKDGLAMAEPDFDRLMQNHSKHFDELKSEAFGPFTVPLPVPPPADAVVLLDDRGTSLFLNRNGAAIDWAMEGGIVTSTPNGHHANHIVSDLHFRDAEIHAEFLVPGESDGNSGIYLHGGYELQILNSWGRAEVTAQDLGSLYGFAPPLVNASRPPGEWQSFDIRYRAPRRDPSGRIVEDGVLTAWLNGQLVQNKTRFGEPKSGFRPFLYRTTDYLRSLAEQYRRTQTGPLFLQDHGNPVRFRNLWIRPLDGLSFRSTEQRASQLEASVAELRATFGNWTVETSTFDPNGELTGQVAENCRFDWLEVDRVLTGRMETSDGAAVTAVQICLDRARHRLELSTVGSDGRLWTLTGEPGSDSRLSGEFEKDDGRKYRLRITCRILPDGALEWTTAQTTDGGQTWLPEKTRVFRRPTGD